MRIKTVWELRNYDVWGNDEDGYTVNDSFIFDRNYELMLEVKVYNKNLPELKFRAAFPSDKQIRKAFGLTNIQLTIDGDDRNIYIYRQRDYYPIGEMILISPSQLSPIAYKRKDLIS